MGLLTTGQRLKGSGELCKHGAGVEGAFREEGLAGAMARGTWWAYRAGRAKPGPGRKERKARGHEDGDWDGVGRSAMGLDGHSEGTAERTS